MSDNNILNFGDAAIIIKDAIIRSRYQAAKLVNKELLGLYYAVGRYVSNNSREGSWGKGAIRQLSDDLQRELPGLRGFGEVSLRKMRLFYEAWQPIFENFSNRQLITDDSSENLSTAIRHSATDDFNLSKLLENGIDLSLLARHLDGFYMPGFSYDEFYRVGFTHHSEILAKEKSLQGRLYYIVRCAVEFWTVDTTKSYLHGDLYAKSGTMPNNFIQTLPELAQAKRAIRAFKEEYFLDFINIEDEIDPDERLLEHGIINNIKQFILSFGGNKFCYMGHNYRVVVDEKEFLSIIFQPRTALPCRNRIKARRV
jgi:predicted nuclease of restriction endonuclease-like (RecB) superfamily